MEVIPEISFDSEIPFPEYNTIIYREVYVVEQWLRRIAYASMMAKCGEKWIGAILPELYKELKSRLSGLPGRVYLDCENANNVIWLSTLEELGQLLTTESIWPIVKVLTGYNHDFISSKIDELREIRNVIGHNRAVTQQTLTIWKGTQASIKNGIETFKSNMLYDAGEIHLDAKKEDIAATIFYLKMRDKKWSRYPLMFSEKEYFYSLTHLPAEPYDRSVRVSTILDTYRSLDRVILAILINRE